MATPTVNPVGTADNKTVSTIVNQVLPKWQDYLKNGWKGVVSFLLYAVEDGAKYLDQSGLINADKKATLMESASNLYDTVVPGLLPIYLRPFAGYIKQFLINIVLNVFVDYIVAKIHQLEDLQNKDNTGK